MMKVIPVNESVGAVLCHDLTRIVPGESKGPAFRKGHIIRKQDIPLLLQIGKEHIYVLDLDGGWVHENEAAERIANAAAGPGLSFSEISEGRINMLASHRGLLKVNAQSLLRINSLEGIALASLHGDQPVEQGQAAAGARIIPLAVEEARIREVESVCAETGPILEVKPFATCEIGVVVTGSEIYHGRIQDAFGPVVERKFAELGSRVMGKVMTSDDRELTVSAIRGFLDQGADMVVCTGGMSVDPDDQTPASIRAAGAAVEAYGAPVFPGAMFMLAYAGDAPILGLPGCVMYHKASIFDLVVPRLLAGERVTRREIANLGHGGFCLGCKVCRWPACAFGKGA
ncbi:MAG: hypothetical protein PWQ57_2108 [Desulfovibrionales bacterium]|jgi:hypothetical protein|nr:hypothetical protein [Desulfovibrionales bacterium]